MTMPVVVVVNSLEIDAIVSDEWVKHMLDEGGQQIATYAAANAPRRTGAGAASIHGELVREGLGEWAVHIAWDQLHRYMVFPDVGTRYQPAQAFLENAFNEYAR